MADECYHSGLPVASAIVRANLHARHVLETAVAGIAIKITANNNNKGPCGPIDESVSARRGPGPFVTGFGLFY